MNRSVELVAAAAAALLLMLLVSGCGYGDISPDAYQYAKALYSIGNRHALGPLDQVSHQIEESFNNGNITRREADLLRDIITDARNDRWDSVCTSSREIMESQLEY